MADQENPVFQIQRVYLKDLSLEQPNSPAILLEAEQPSVDIQIGVEAAPAAEGIFEICVTATVHTRIKDQMGAIVGIACPQIIYPYLRGNVADVINRAGFPPVHLAEINFQAMYEQQQAQAADAPSSQLPQ